MSMKLLPQRAPARILDPIVRGLARIGVTPNMLTVAGFVGNAIAAVLVVQGWLIARNYPIEAMQQEVNEFMTYVKGELSRGIGDWEQRLSTALVKSSPTDLVRHTPPAEGQIPEARGAKRKS